MTRWNNMNNYSGEDVYKMKQDAVNRVLEMQRKANEKIKETNFSENIPSQIPPIKSPPSFYENITKTNNKIESISNQSKFSLKDIIKNIDSEKLIIMGLIYILYTEGEDNTLLLALFYLLF